MLRLNWQTPGRHWLPWKQSGTPLWPKHRQACLDVILPGNETKAKMSDFKQHSLQLPKPCCACLADSTLAEHLTIFAATDLHCQVPWLTLIVASLMWRSSKLCRYAALKVCVTLEHVAWHFLSSVCKRRQLKGSQQRAPRRRGTWRKTWQSCSRSRA